MCQEQVAQLRDVKDEIESLGAKLVVVGNGSAMFARMFAEDQKLLGAVYTDPTRAVYRALGMKDGIKSALKLGALKNAWRAYRAGYRQTSVQGDPLQQGGVLVVGPDGAIAYAYLSETAGDHPPVDEVLDALRTIAKP
jgi:peroxiredoxin